ncbi:MAG: hypothetical protein A3D65_01785 [Candidatus Lloydbacteria bacterium RIFCSPHIGHO2_02_FULL_50_13]|uniref:Uncharacterized protein n=1 Tax=Candidatus Lloydbacteria bacterium RIFCSPHIGHO2_02_FULL_50_13 TaxID=1798661 RepID=A0A1G2DA95_9BACT|nr:MAG: hypothetical protein A3D65_01785 [Candidatus Lloydbacteria bacterium RIFCSPHIGHO2_02_FULL_50_13]
MWKTEAKRGTAMQKCTGVVKNVVSFHSRDSRHPRQTTPGACEGGGNDLLPRKHAQRLFTLPRHMTAERLKRSAQTISMSDFSVVIPRECPYPERFEAGFRHGLESNALNRPGYLKRSFRWGFCWAKVYYQTFFPNHPLTANFPGGRARFKNAAIE